MIDNKSIKLIFVLTLSIIINFECFCEQIVDLNDDIILQVHVSFRHGDRTKNFSDTYPNDPNINFNEKLYPLSEGQLTNKGKQRAYQLGKMLRKRYNNFLGDFYDAEIVKTISTDIDRTKMTAELVLAGLFPPNKVQQWDDNLLWQPIPVDYMKKDDDTFLNRRNKFCPNYNNELHQLLNDNTEKILEDNRLLIEFIENNSRGKFDTLKSLQDLYQTTYVEDQMNLTIPEWMKKIYPEPLGSLASINFQLSYATTHLRRLNGGHIWRKILNDLKHKVHGMLEPKGRKIYLYSGHRKNAINLLAALGIWDLHLPPFCAATIIELVYRNKTNEHGIKIYYYDQVAEEPKLLEVPECGDTFCEFNKFSEIIKPIIAENYTAECGSNVNLDVLPF